jgi:antitoxin component of RelBE/YafQ-DinJ toxin-antitoxin module
MATNKPKRVEIQAEPRLIRAATKLAKARDLDLSKLIRHLLREAIRAAGIPLDTDPSPSTTNGSQVGK